MFIPKDREILQAIAELAKKGDSEAIEYLQRKYTLRVFTTAEVAQVNALREQGMTTEQAIKRVKEEQNG